MALQNYTPSNRLAFLRKSDTELLKLSRVDVFKATGKGGQKKNKTSNAIRLTFFHLIVTESGSRSKTENLKKALTKLRLAIAMDAKAQISDGDEICQAAEEIKPYLGSGEIRISAKNPLYPLFVSYLFDCFIRHQGNWRAMASDSGFTASQIRKFIQRDSRLQRYFSEREKDFTFLSGPDQP